MRIVGLALLLAGCGARVDGPAAGDPPDAGPGGGGADAAGQPQPDAPLSTADNACGVAQSQGDLGTLAAQGGARQQEPDNPLLVYSLAALTPATAMQPAPDAVYVELWEGYGVFADGGATPGTYTIAGDELSYATCGVCVFTLADLSQDTGATHVLLATSGEIIVQAVSADVGAPLSVDLRNIRFQEVNPQDFSPVPGSDCESPVDRAELDGSVESIDGP